MPQPWQEVLKKIDDYRWEIPTSYKPGMSVPGLIFTSESMLSHIWEEQVFQQVANVAFLPGIVGRSLAMPDIHWGSLTLIVASDSCGQVLLKKR